MNQIVPSNEAGETVIEASPHCSANEPYQDSPYTLPISPNLRATLTALGMSEEAFASWETFHVSPAHAMLYFFGSMITGLGSLCYLQVFGVPFTRYHFTIPSMLTIVMGFCHLESIWRMGPQVARSKLFISSLLVPWTCTTANILVSYLGPIANMPFGSLPHFLVVVGVFLYFINLSNKSGVLLSAHLPT